MKSEVPALLLSLTFAVSLAGCGGIPDVEGRVTITQGVYGQLVSGCDTSGCTDRVITRGEVAAFDAPPPSGTLTRAPVARDAVDEAGFYELSLAPGTYHLAWVVDEGSGPGVHTRVEAIVVADGIARWDFTSGPGGGIWQER